MNLCEFWNNLGTDEKKEAYAKASGTTVGYCKTHLMIRVPRKIARKPLMKALARESSGNVSYEEVLHHFYGSKKLAVNE